MKNILYAVYGSNLCRERFYIYIKGGKFKDKGNNYQGCKDQTEPEDYGNCFVPYRLYFAKESSKWDKKGVAFLTCEKEENKEYHVLVRLWKTTEEQFDCIWKQEGKSFYHSKLYLGEKEGLEIYTLTGCWLKERNRPTEEYLHWIKIGLKETISWTDKEIEKYISKFL